MPSFFTRLRAQTITPTPSVVVVPAAPEQPVVQPTITSYRQRINRKIHPDPNALLATFTTQLQEQAQNDQDRGLRPSSRRPFVDGALFHSSNTHIPAPEATLDEVSEPAVSRDPSQTRTAEASNDQPHYWLLHRFSQLASSSTWSTFGRGRQHPSPRMDQLNKTDSQSGTPRNPSRATTHHGDQPLSRKSSAKPRSSISHESPSSESKLSSMNNSTTTPGSRSRPGSVRTHVTTTAVSMNENSPHTFGHPTPEVQSSPLLGDGSPLPPLPPLVHHALHTIQASQEKENEAQGDIPTTIRRDTGALYHSPKDQGTYPRRSRISKNLYDFSSRSRSKSSSPPKTFPKAEQIFVTDTVMIQNVDNDTVNAPTRRSSAEWNTQQAVAADESWQAQLPRKLLVASQSRDIAPSASSILSSPSSLSPSLGAPFLLEDHGSKFSLRWPSIRKKRRATAFGSLDATMTGQKKKASDRGSTPPSRPSTAPRSVEGADVGPSLHHQIPFQSFSAASSPTPGSGSDSPSAKQLHRRSVSDPQRKPAKRRSALSTPVKAAPRPSTEDGHSTPAGAVSKGKRKADDVEGTPPDQKRDGQRATFALPVDSRPSRASANSASSTYAPSSNQRKRARLSASTPVTLPVESGSGSSHHEGGNRGHHHASSRITHPERDGLSSSRSHGFHSRPSLSQVSIPISALVSPHAPSVSRSGTFYMRDPRKPPRVMETGWALRLSTAGEPGSGSPVHAWLFFVGWVIFPLWWVGSLLRTPQTRQVGGTEDMEKSVVLDDPQVEFDARSWRSRCRIMSAISFMTYIPFIILVAIFVHKSR